MKQPKQADDTLHKDCTIRIKRFTAPEKGFSWRVTGGNNKYLCAWCRRAFYDTKEEALNAARLWIDKGVKPKFPYP